MGTDWYLGTGTGYIGRNRGTSASITDYWNSPGGRTYYGAIRCVDGAGNGGLMSGRGAASVNVYTPAPSTPTWVSANGTFSRSTKGGFVLNDLTVSAGGSSYASGYTRQDQVKDIYNNWTGWGQHGCIDRTSTINYRASAYGPGGSSGWRTASKPVSSLKRINYGCF